MGKRIYILKRTWNDGEEPKNIHAYSDYNDAVKGVRKCAQKRLAKLRKRENGQDYFLTELYDSRPGVFSCVCICNNNTGKVDQDGNPIVIPRVDQQPYDWDKIVRPSLGYYYLEQIPYTRS